MVEAHESIGDLLGRCLRALGVTRVFGSSLSGITGIAGLGHVRVDDPELAVLLGDTHGRITVGRHPGAALLPGRRLRVGSQPGEQAPTVSITDAATMVDAVAEYALVPGFGCVEFELDVDLDQPAPPGLQPLSVAPAVRPMTLSPSLAELGLVVLAGPGVARADEVAALRAFAAATGIGVIETFGAAGLLTPDDPARRGIVGLQADDARLSGLADAGVVVMVGLDPAETPPGGWTDRQVLDVEPVQLRSLVYNWPAPDTGGASGPHDGARPNGDGHRPAKVASPLQGAVASVVDEARRSVVAPLSPARAAYDLRLTMRDGGSVYADPGPAGLWVLRALPVPDVGRVVVPALPAPGFAVAAAMIAALDERPATAVTVGPLDAMTRALLELAGRVGSRFTLVEWGAEATWTDAHAHPAALQAAARAPGIAHVPVPVDLSGTEALVAALGPTVAWSRRR